MHHQRATSQDFFPPIYDGVQQIMTSVQVVGFPMERLNKEIYLQFFKMCVLLITRLLRGVGRLDP